MKTNWLLLLLLTTLVCGCQKNYTGLDGKNHTQLVADQFLVEEKKDTTLLDFVFQQPREEVDRHISDLIKTGQLEGKRVWTLPSGTVEGYKYVLRVGDSLSCECVLQEDYFEEKLSRISLLVLGENHLEPLQKFLTHQYGTSCLNTLGSKTSEWYWMQDGNEVMLADLAPICKIEYSNLGLKTLGRYTSLDSLLALQTATLQSLERAVKKKRQADRVNGENGR